MRKKININDVYIPYLNNESRVLLLYGGAGSGKSHFAAQKIILRCVTEQNHKILVLRKIGSTLRDSCFSLLKEIIYEFGLQSEFIIYKSTMSFEHVNGSTIILKGLDEPEKIKSIAGVTSMWLEEATEFEYKDYSQLLLRIRGEMPTTIKYVQYILSFNPISEYHWLKRNIIDNIQTFDSYEYVHTTYRDNHYMTEEDKKQLENLKFTNPLYYQIYCEGEWGIEDKSGKFAYAFDQDKHIVSGLEWTKAQYTYLSFDFNVNPICCSVIQWYDDTIKVIQLIKLENSNIHAMCDYINAKYHKGIFIVTGDATGQSRSALVKDNINYYTVIKDKLNLLDTQLQIPGGNPPIQENKVLVNTILSTKKVQIDKDNAKDLIFDLKYVEITQDNKIKKFNRDDDKQKADALDTFRYFCNTFLKSELLSS